MRDMPDLFPSKQRPCTALSRFPITGLSRRRRRRRQRVIVSLSPRWLTRKRAVIGTCFRFTLFTLFLFRVFPEKRKIKRAVPLFFFFLNIFSQYLGWTLLIKIKVSLAAQLPPWSTFSRESFDSHFVHQTHVQLTVFSRENEIHNRTMLVKYTLAWVKRWRFSISFMENDNFGDGIPSESLALAPVLLMNLCFGRLDNSIPGKTWFKQPAPLVGV